MTRTVQQLFDLGGRTALITGGSRGLGLQLAQALGEAGARVMLTSRKAADLEEAAATLQAAGIDARWIAADASREEDLRRVADETLQRMGDVDILVNNAGATWGAPAEDHPVAAWDKVMNLNVRGYFLLSQQIGRASMIPRRSGRILNVASVAGLGGNPPEMQTLAYNTSKGAVINFTRALACEWGRHGITVNALCPGFFPSRMTRGSIEKWGEAGMAARVPLQRLGDDEDLKGAAVLFASDAGKHITGQWLAVDGGVSAVTVAEDLFGRQELVIPFVHHLGLVLTRFEDGESRIEYEVRPEHMNTFQVAHGGVVMTLLDVAMATAARSLQPDMGAVTVEMKTSFMLPSRGRLLAEGRVMNRTATMAFVEAHIRTTPGGRASAHATGTFKYVRRLPVGPRQANGRTVISTD